MQIKFTIKIERAGKKIKWWHLSQGSIQMLPGKGCQLCCSQGKTWKQKRNNYHYLDWYHDLNQNPRDSHLFILVIERKIFPVSLTRHFFKHKYTDGLQACRTAVVDCHCLKGPFVSKICDVDFFFNFRKYSPAKKIQWAQIKSDQFTRVHGLQHSPLSVLFPYC